MKKLFKLWDLILIAILGVFESGCILDPPAPEYGVEPMYGVLGVYRESGDGQSLPQKALTENIIHNRYPDQRTS